MIRANDTTEALTPYVAPLEGRRPMLRLDFNENTLGPSPAVVAAIRALVPGDYATYPEYAGLNEAFAASVGLGARELCAFNGVDAALRALFDAFGEPGTTLLTTSPTFGYYRPCAELSGMRIHAVPYTEQLSFPWAPFEQALESSPRLCVICNPNNPTGTLAETEGLLALARRFPHTLFAIDEVYEAFTGQSVLPEAARTDNVLALRSLSKAAGLAGLRMGFACGPASVIERLARVVGPYDVNSFAVVAAKAALSDPEHVRRYVAEVAEAKAWTRAALDRLGVRHAGEGGNYLLVWPGRSPAAVEASLRARGVLVRPMDGKPLIDGSFRLSIGTREQMQRFIEDFEAVLAEG